MKDFLLACIGGVTGTVLALLALYALAEGLSHLAVNLMLTP